VGSNSAHRSSREDTHRNSSSREATHRRVEEPTMAERGNTTSSGFALMWSKLLRHRCILYVRLILLCADADGIYAGDNSWCSSGQLSTMLLHHHAGGGDAVSCTYATAPTETPNTDGEERAPHTRRRLSHTAYARTVVSGDQLRLSIGPGLGPAISMALSLSGLSARFDCTDMGSRTKTSADFCVEVAKSNTDT